MYVLQLYATLYATLFAVVFILPAVVIETYAGDEAPKYLLYAAAELALFTVVIWLIWF